MARFDGKDFKVVYGPAYNIKVDNHNNKWFMNYNEVLRCENLVVYNEDGLQGINGIEENYTNNDETQLIFPNPATDFIEISVGAGSEPALTGDVKIYDIFGQTLVSIRAGFEPAPTIQIDVSGLAPGLYFVRIGDKVSKFVKL